MLHKECAFLKPTIEFWQFQRTSDVQGGQMTMKMQCNKREKTSTMELHCVDTITKDIQGETNGHTRQDVLMN